MTTDQQCDDMAGVPSVASQEEFNAAAMHMGGVVRPYDPEVGVCITNTGQEIRKEVMERFLENSSFGKLGKRIVGWEVRENDPPHCRV
jgi:hypothetical protein